MRSKESLCGRFNIRSYPTVIVFDGATGVTGYNYTGKHTYEAMDAFLEAQQANLCLISEDEAMEPNDQCGKDEIKFLRQWRERGGDVAGAELE